jgi:hypothetical protein
MYTYIYALCDPKTKEVRYVGKADNPNCRYVQHLSDNGRTWKANWVKKLKLNGLRPSLKILEEVHEDEWELKERDWIAHYRRLGARLTNLTDGGTTGGVFEPSACIKISDKKRKCHQPSAKDYCLIDWNTGYQRWTAKLQFQGEMIDMGMFHSRGDAMDCYDHLAETVYGLPTFINLRTETKYRLRGRESPFLT